MTAWREFRAYVATILYGWAQAASMEATLVKARETYRLGLVRRAAAGDRAAVDKIRRLNRKRGK